MTLHARVYAPRKLIGISHCATAGRLTWTHAQVLPLRRPTGDFQVAVLPTFECCSSGERETSSRASSCPRSIGAMRPARCRPSRASTELRGPPCRAASTWRRPNPPAEISRQGVRCCAVGILQPPARLPARSMPRGEGLWQLTACCRTGPSSCAYSFSRRRRICFRSSARTWPRRPW